MARTLTNLKETQNPRTALCCRSRSSVRCSVPTLAQAAQPVIDATPHVKLSAQLEQARTQTSALEAITKELKLIRFELQKIKQQTDPSPVRLPTLIDEKEKQKLEEEADFWPVSLIGLYPLRQKRGTGKKTSHAPPSPFPPIVVMRDLADAPKRQGLCNA